MYLCHLHVDANLYALLGMRTFKIRMLVSQHGHIKVFLRRHALSALACAFEHTRLSVSQANAHASKNK